MPSRPDLATARRCRATPAVTVVDARGLPVRTIRYNRTLDTDLADERIGRQVFSTTGWLTTSCDARLGDIRQTDPDARPNFRCTSSLSGRSLRVRSQDAGDQCDLYDVEGGLRWHCHSDRSVEQTFDILHRPVATRETANGISRTGTQRIYADRDPRPAAICMAACGGCTCRPA